MKKVLILGGVIVAVLAGIVGAVLWNIHSQKPEVLLRRLARGGGDKEKLIMRLNVARGDVTTPMLKAFRNKDNPAGFRADVLELLARRNCHSPDTDVETVMVQATKDPELLVRRRAVSSICIYGEDRLKTKLVDNIDDPDPAIRYQVYLLMSPTPPRRYSPSRSRVWESLTKEQKERTIKVCRERMKTEDTEEMRLQARAVIGREVEERGIESRQALQTADVKRAEELLRKALALDPGNCQGQIRLSRFYLKMGEQEKALALAKQYGALIEIPQLSGAPVIDADPSDEVWGEAYMAEKFYHTTSRWIQRPIKGKSKAYIGHLNGKIYIAVIGYEEDLGKLVQVHRGRDSDVWADDCVELIFDPGNTEKDTYQFVINPAGALFDNFNGDIGKNFKCEYKARIFRDRGYWACEFALEGKELDNYAIKPGVIWSLIVFRVRIGAASEHGAIWPLFGGAHNVQLYPIAVFK